MYTCPVCGYDRLSAPPRDFSICPSCGTEFGLDDYDATPQELRKRWLMAGAVWWSPNTPPPPHWSPFEQLRRQGLTSDVLQARVRTIFDELSFTHVDLISGAQIMGEERRFNYTTVERNVEAEISSTAC